MSACSCCGSSTKALKARNWPFNASDWSWDKRADFLESPEAPPGFRERGNFVRARGGGKKATQHALCSNCSLRAVQHLLIPLLPSVQHPPPLQAAPAAAPPPAAQAAAAAAAPQRRAYGVRSRSRRLRDRPRWLTSGPAASAPYAGRWDRWRVSCSTKRAR
eukprot:XP_001696848.1 predicted protein [Chlamydomonas reinhardtii]